MLNFTQNPRISAAIRGYKAHKHERNMAYKMGVQ